MACLQLGDIPIKRTHEWNVYFEDFSDSEGSAVGSA